MSLAQTLSLLRAVYTCSRNDERRAATVALLRWEESLPREEAVSVGLGLLKAFSEGIAVQAYGAVLLRHALHAQRVPPADLPLMDLLAWYCNDPSLSPLLRTDLLELLVECAIFSAPDVLDSVLATLCTDAEAQPRRMLLLSEVVVALLDPNFERVPRQLIGQLKRSVTRRGSELLRTATQALHAYFTASGGAQATALAPGTEDCVEAAFALIAVVAPQVPFAVWEERSLAVTLGVLLEWAPGQRQAISCATALLRSYSPSDSGKAAVLQVFLEIVLRKVAALVAWRDIATLDDVLNLLVDLPRDFTQRDGAVLVQTLLSVFSMPSILFAQQAVQLMERVSEDTLRQVDPVPIYEGLHSLLPKNACGPTSGVNAEGRELSLEQFGFDLLFERTFADFRRGASQVLTTLARLHPARTNGYVLRLLSELPDPSGTPQDPRTPCGFVQQRSATFAAWEAVQFAVECLSAAFEGSSEGVNACVSALLAREPTDAVLRPLYFNMLSYFWKVRDAQELNVWEGTATILFNCIDDEATRRSKDLDITAARRRAHTLLVQMCVDHSRRFQPIVSALTRKIEPMVMRAIGMERSLLYEALVALTTAMPPQEADAYLQKVLNPVVEMLGTNPAMADQGAFNRVLCAASAADQSERHVLQGSLDILAAVFRRCQMTPYLVEKAGQLFPQVGRLMLCLHSIQPAALAPEFRGILEQEDGEKALYLPGSQRRSEAHLTGPVRAARAILAHMRVAVYQIFGALSPVLSAENCAEMLAALAPLSAMPVNVARPLSEKCLFSMGRDHPSLLEKVFGLLRGFFTQRAQVVREQRLASGAVHSARDEVAEGKQWSFFARDTLSFVRSVVVDSQAWQRDHRLLLEAFELSAVVFDSGADTLAAERFLLQLVGLSPAEGISTEVQAARLSAYAKLVHFVTQATAGELPQNIREPVAFALSEPYLRFFPDLAPALPMAGVPQESVETLHAYLVVIGGVAAQRRKMKDFLLGIAAARMAALEGA